MCVGRKVKIGKGKVPKGWSAPWTGLTQVINSVVVACDVSSSSLSSPSSSSSFASIEKSKGRSPYLKGFHIWLRLSSLYQPNRTTAHLPLCQSLASIMDHSSSSSSTYTLILSGKSSQENEFAVSLAEHNSIKLPDNTQLSLLLESPEKEESFDKELFFKSLSSNQFGRLLLWSPRLPSTHDVVSHNFSELPIGTVCVADIQTKGRGRSKNVWESPLGCLLFSFTVQMEDGRVVPLLQYVVSLAVTEAIKDVCHKNGLPFLDVKIKWPNDLYLNGLKVGGILCTSTYRSKKFNVSAGIGLNVDNEKPTTCLNSVLRELSATASQLRREEILSAFFHKFENLYNLFVNQGFQTLEELYYRAWLHSGQRVIIQENCGDQVVENVVTIQGLTSSGYLLAIGEDNQMCELHPDGNSLDFFKGLVRKKLE